ncbi:D-arabinono-1,4-lactone oxidase [Micrococcus sp. FDAARGOS_333]|uniref:D-arabinono-1,4-lactone oxidase n=1 Tax=Micrococcus sp. FDAARGOS_333 TaxID=1930558 RepID=UPI000B4E4024|nr:D-arabinono-1,4-lactone oxidase [Micrococcus sp. FDAARGOS_333]PNL17153.1 FAD-binding protein [Micrococcus sp. FDAARGOS_333]
MSASSAGTTTRPTAHNWCRFQSWTPSAVVRPAGVEELASVVEQAAARGGRVKPIGAGHSFSPVAATDDVQLDLGALTGLTGIDREAGRVRVRAGTRLSALGPLLGAHGLALANMGDIDRQTVGGAISTSTHGTGLGHTGYSGMVAGLEILTADGRLRRVDAAHEPELFEAARVSLGALGVVTEVELAVCESFLLRAEERAEPIDETVSRFQERSRTADHHEFYWFPGTGLGLTKLNTRLPLGSGLDPLPPLRTKVMDGLLANGAYELMCRLGAAVPRTVPVLNGIACRGLDQRTYTDISYNVFAANRSVRFTEMEYAMPLEHFEQAFAGLREICAGMFRDGRGVSFPVEVRTAAADDVWLSTAHGRDSVYIAVHRYHREDPTDYFREVEDLFVSLGGRPHWGKMNTRDAAWTAQAYPRHADWCAVRDAVDPQRVFTNAYVDRLFGP